MPSKHFNALNKRLTALRKHLLPASFSPTNVYSESQLDHARAYRVLAHAEIEYYLEQRALDVAQAAFDKWRTDTQPSRTLVACLANVVGEQQGLPKRLGTNDNVTTFAGKALSQFKHAVTHNNGVKAENILRLFLPIGLLESEIDSIWIATIDGFGTKRGVAAHSSAISYSVNPQDDHSTVTLVLAGIRLLDERITRIKRTIR